jgi:outer membrane protein assembly factor BamB
MNRNGKYAGFVWFALFLLCTPAFQPGPLWAQQKVDPAAAPVSAAPLWEQNLEDIVTGTPFLQASSVVLACDGGSVKSFFMSGTPLWSFDPRDRVAPFIARAVEGTTYVCNAGGVFMAVNRVGRELWRLNLGKPISFPPVVGWDGRVFIPVESRVLCRTASGRALWEVDLGSPPAAAPVLDHAGSVALVLRNQEFVRISQFSAVERVRLERVPAMIVSLVNGDQHSYTLLYPAGEMEKITFNDSAPRGSKLSRSRFTALPAAPVAAVSPPAAGGRGNQFAVTLRDGRVLCIDGSGSVLWTKNSHETTAEKGAGNLALGQAGMIFDERGVFTISVHGAAGFSAEGRRRFIIKYPYEASGIPALSDEGLLYACGKDKVLRLYKLDDKGRTVPRYKYYGLAPEGSYGMGSPPPSPWMADTRRYEDEHLDRMYSTIERAIRGGQLGENEPAYVGYLMEMIGFFLNDPHYSPVRPAVKPPHRVKLINLLGQIGSRETVPFLWHIFDRDPEPAVRIACAEAIGTIGVDPTGRSFESYNFLLSSNNPNRDQQLLLAATSSIAALCRYAGPPMAADGLRILRYYMNLPSFPNHIKAQIQEQVNALRREGLDRVLN